MPIANYLQQRFSHALRGRKSTDESTLPPHLEWSKIRGEALFITRFFQYFEQKNMSDISSHLFFLDHFKKNPDVLAQLSMNTGLMGIFRSQVGSSYLDKTPEYEQHYTAYCCLLWDIHQQKNHILLDTTTTKLFGHFATSIFPSRSQRTDINKLKQEIRKKLAQAWNERPEIKESFHEHAKGITFSLIARLSNQPNRALITIEGKRLKPTRLKAYQTVIEKLEKTN